MTPTRRQSLLCAPTDHSPVTERRNKGGLDRLFHSTNRTKTLQGDWMISANGLAWGFVQYPCSFYRKLDGYATEVNSPGAESGAGVAPKTPGLDARYSRLDRGTLGGVWLSGAAMGCSPCFGTNPGGQ